VSNKVIQEGNVVHGSMAAHDVNIFEAPRGETVLARLFRRLKTEAAEDRVLSEYIGELEIFTRQVENEDVIGLEEKLKAAGRDDQLIMAMKMKEMIFASLSQNIFSPTFQQIYATLIGKVFEEFETWVKPAIQSDADRATIDILVNTKVIKPIIAEVEQCGEYAGIVTQTIRGMVYFLTGNCHIRWHKC
jgi:hypothetical protein